MGKMGLLKGTNIAESLTVSDQNTDTAQNTAIATFAGGCFWCVEAVFKDLKGVSAVQSGFMGGHLDNPSYRAVCAGGTGHAETIKVTYDSSVIGYDTLLDVFFATHDPTTLNRQGNDVGDHYRSAVFVQSDEQATAAKAAITRAGEIWDDPIVTEVVKSDTFWPAEDYHDDYFAQNPEQAYCAMVIAPKVRKARQAFTALLKNPG